MLSVCLALCPNALEALTKDKSWQCFIIDLLILCQSRYYDQSRILYNSFDNHDILNPTLLDFGPVSLEVGDPRWVR